MITQTFPNITPAKWADIQAVFAKAGISVNGNSGKDSHMGVQYEWKYDGSSLTAIVDKVSILDKADGYTEQVVMNKFAALVNSVQYSQ